MVLGYMGEHFNFVRSKSYFRFDFLLLSCPIFNQYWRLLRKPQILTSIVCNFNYDFKYLYVQTLFYKCVCKRPPHLQFCFQNSQSPVWLIKFSKHLNSCICSVWLFLLTSTVLHLTDVFPLKATAFCFIKKHFHVRLCHY